MFWLLAGPYKVNCTRILWQNHHRLPNNRFFKPKFFQSSSTSFCSIFRVLVWLGSNGFPVSELTRLVLPAPESPRIKHCPWNTNCLIVESSSCKFRFLSTSALATWSSIKPVARCNCVKKSLVLSRLQLSARDTWCRTRPVSWSMLLFTPVCRSSLVDLSSTHPIACDRPQSHSA